VRATVDREKGISDGYRAVGRFGFRGSKLWCGNAEGSQHSSGAVRTAESDFGQIGPREKGAQFSIIPAAGRTRLNNGEKQERIIYGHSLQFVAIAAAFVRFGRAVSFLPGSDDGNLRRREQGTLEMGKKGGGILTRDTGPVSLELASNGSACGLTGSAEARNGGNDFRSNGLRVVQRIGRVVENSLKHVRSGRRRFAGRSALIQHPACEHGLGGFLDPLVDENTDFTTEIGSVIDPCKFKTL
jgi:hypothetical protein